MNAIFRRLLPWMLVLAGWPLLAWAADAEENAINAWKQWKDIGPAIELRSLDDPSDILEKAEIIEDRVDKL